MQFNIRVVRFGENQRHATIVWLLQSDAESVSSLIPSGFVVESAYQDGDRAIITVRPCTGCPCPSCGTLSLRVHSHYRGRD